MHQITRTALVVASLAFCTAVNAQLTSSGMQPGGVEQGETSRSSTKAAKMPFDHQFLDTMTMHHTHGIEMAELAQERAAHDELKQMAKKMIDDQQQDIKKMQGMKEQWFAGKGDATNM